MPAWAPSSICPSLAGGSVQPHGCAAVQSCMGSLAMACVGPWIASGGDIASEDRDRTCPTRHRPAAGLRQLEHAFCKVARNRRSMHGATSHVVPLTEARKSCVRKVRCGGTRGVDFIIEDQLPGRQTQTQLPMTYSIEPIEPGGSVEALLSANHLPTSDLKGGARVMLFGCVTDARLRGVVGLEIHGQVALLRSLAVPASERSSGLGAALVAHAEQFAARQGVEAIYLLTTSAAGYFERRGYSHVPRQAAPQAIANTSQFSDLCPSSSAFMAKSLGNRQTIQAGSAAQAG